MRDLRIWLALSVAGCLGAALSCARGPSEEPAQKDAPAPPVVSDSRSDLVFSWFSDGGPGVASSVKEVPEELRKEVRVQDPSVPPEKSDPRWIFLADLTRPGPDGRYPVRVVRREAYERENGIAVLRAPPPADTGPAAPATGKRVVMYATRSCPVCREARRWLVDRQIPYTEKDIERDPAAARELAEKGAAQRVPVKGVPVFEIGGRLIPGFEPDLLLRALSADGRAPADQVI